MVAASMGLSIALISIAKFFLMICAIVALLMTKNTKDASQSIATRYTPALVLVSLSVMALSLLWTVAPAADALGSLAKYGKLLTLILLMVLIRNRREAICALGWFVGAQLFLVISSWALFVHLPVPWATSNMALTEYAVFSSYLDQGIMGSVLAAICWHLRHLAPGQFGKQLAAAVAVVAVSNVLFVLSGRSGHVVAIALLSFAITWQLPRRYRAAIVLLPFLLAMALFFSSAKVRSRLTMVNNEVQSYSSQEQSNTSSGIRLGLWRNAIQMIAEHPFAGSGVGSWSTEYNRLQRVQNPAHKDIDGNGNPHQEYLQWGVQLGLPGIALFLALLLCVMRDTLEMDKAVARAAQSTLVALCVACLFNSSLYDAMIGDFFCVALGLLLALGTHPETQEQALAKPATGKAANNGQLA
ncbi:MAG: O-antigen ligase family protein [Polaromonas sp.]|nr:O-antigen ligase family protein [Polaromonas sp.]